MQGTWVQHRYLALLIPTLTQQYGSGWQQQHHLFEVRRVWNFIELPALGMELACSAHL